MSNKFLKCASWVILSRYLCGTVKRLRLQLPILKLNYDSFSSWPSYNPFIAFIAFRNNGYDPRSLDYTPIKAAAQKVSLIRSCAQRKEDFDNIRNKFFLPKNLASSTPKARVLSDLETPAF